MFLSLKLKGYGQKWKPGKAVAYPWGQYQDKVSFLLMQVAGRPGIMESSSLDDAAVFPYFFGWRCFAAGAVPGLQNQWMAERSSVGSTPMHLRHKKFSKPPQGVSACGGSCFFSRWGNSLKKLA